MWGARVNLRQTANGKRTTEMAVALGGSHFHHGTPKEEDYGFTARS